MHWSLVLVIQSLNILNFYKKENINFLALNKRITNFKEKKPKHDPESYRPIMITPVLGKLMEKMIYHRLLWFVEKNNLIPHTQTGFRKHHSSTDAFIVLTNAINESL